MQKARYSNCNCANCFLVLSLGCVCAVELSHSKCVENHLILVHCVEDACTFQAPVPNYCFTRLRKKDETFVFVSPSIWFEMHTTECLQPMWKFELHCNSDSERQKSKREQKREGKKQARAIFFCQTNKIVVRNKLKLMLYVKRIIFITELENLKWKEPNEKSFRWFPAPIECAKAATAAVEGSIHTRERKKMSSAIETSHIAL